jgi:hypothetical protein
LKQLEHYEIGVNWKLVLQNIALLEQFYSTQAEKRICGSEQYRPKIDWLQCDRVRQKWSLSLLVVGSGLWAIFRRANAEVRV